MTSPTDDGSDLLTPGTYVLRFFALLAHRRSDRKGPGDGRKPPSGCVGPLFCALLMNFASWLASREKDEPTGERA